MISRCVCLFLFGKYNVLKNWILHARKSKFMVSFVKLATLALDGHITNNVGTGSLKRVQVLLRY